MRCRNEKKKTKNLSMYICIYVYNVIGICNFEMRCNLIIFGAMLSVRLILRRCNKHKNKYNLDHFFSVIFFRDFLFFFVLVFQTFRVQPIFDLVRFILFGNTFSHFSMIICKLAHANAHNHQKKKNLFHIHFERL